MSKDITPDVNSQGLSGPGFNPVCTSTESVRSSVMASPTTTEEHESEAHEDGSLPKFKTAITETTHIMTFTYRPTAISDKRRPRKIAPAPVGPSGSGVPDTANTGSPNSPIVDMKVKDARTLEGIKSGKYYSMVHQFPDVLAKHGRGPINLDRETGKMSYPNGVFVPLTQRGHERIAEHRKKMEEKATEEGLRRRSSLRKLWDRLATKKSPENQTTELNVPSSRLLNSGGAATGGNTAVATVNQSGSIPDSSTKPDCVTPGSLRMSEDHQSQQEAGGQAGSSGHSGTDQIRDEESPIQEEEERGGDRESRCDEVACDRSRPSSISASNLCRDTNGSTEVQYLQKQVAVTSDRTFKVPTRMQNAFLSNRGSELSLEANNNAIEAA